VIEIRDKSGKALVQADNDLRNLFPNLTSGLGSGLRLPSWLSGKDIYFSLRRKDCSVNNSRWQQATEGRIQIIGVTFPEESGWRQSDVAGFFWYAYRIGPKVPLREIFYLARAGRAGGQT